MNKTFKIMIIIIVLAGLLFWRVMVGIKEGEQEIAPQGKSRVRVQDVLITSVRRGLNYTGEIKGINEADVYSDVPGILREKLKRAGDKVKQDEVILRIDRDEVGLEYSMSSVESPIDGRILEIIPDTGERVVPQRPVARVGNTDKVKIITEITPEDSLEIKLGQTAQIKVDIYPDRIFKGKVSQIGAGLKNLSRKVQIEITANNPGEVLKSGMLCDVEIIVDEVKKKTAVPRCAVVERDGKKGIFIVDEENIARWKEVGILVEGDKYIAVDGKIEKGAKVVVEGNYGLVPDREVQIQ